VPFVLLGSGLLWFGWFGFNAGSAGAANGIAGLAFATTMFAPAGTVVVWAILDLLRVGKVTAVGLATAIVVGLVAVTPAAGLISPMNALLLGAIAAVPSYFMLVLRANSGFDDSLDVVAAHGVGGTVGALLTGVFADASLNGGLGNGVLYGNGGQLMTQLIAVVTAIVYSAVLSFILLKIVGLITPLRADAESEDSGLDTTQHGEEGYVH
jgi:Amt family ammonium transporter